MRILQPAGWPRPKGYANGIEAEGRLIFVGGQIGWTKDQKFKSLDIVGQFEQTLRNIVTILTEAGAMPEHVVRMTWYVTDKKAYLADLNVIGRIYRQIMGTHFPAMAVIQVVGLIEDQALIEIEATAVVPD